jgi:quercetin dioxygenase-like cupin family protein
MSEGGRAEQNDCGGDWLTIGPELDDHGGGGGLTAADITCRMDRMSGPVIHADLHAIPLRTTEQPAYDRPFELELLHHDERSGAEHYVVRYRPGTRAHPHRHTAAHTIIVLDGHMTVDDQLLGPGGYAHHPGGTIMLHEPAEDESCTFVLIFDASFDLHLTGATSDA